MVTEFLRYNRLQREVSNENEITVFLMIILVSEMYVIQILKMKLVDHFGRSRVWTIYIYTHKMSENCNKRKTCLIFLIKRSLLRISVNCSFLSNMSTEVYFFVR